MTAATDFYLSVDIDWAHDDVILDCLDLIDASGVPATWFVTHDTPALARIRASGRHELGWHPNFNPILEGAGGTAAEVISRLREIVPEARSVRSHSLVRSSRLARLCAEAGVTHESNILVPPASSPELKPWRDFCGLVQVPIRWEDDIYLADRTLGQPAEHVEKTRCYVVDFHPIHVFLNTATLRDYEDSWADARNPQALLKRRRLAGAGGVRDWLISLLQKVTESAVPGRHIGSIRPEGVA